jgi:hypothetical protein
MAVCEAFGNGYGTIFCCAHCAAEEGVREAADRAGSSH